MLAAPHLSVRNGQQENGFHRQGFRERQGVQARKTTKFAAGDKPRARAPAKFAHTPHRFDGRVVITTGAAAGLGRATVLRPALEGAAQVLVDLKKDALRQVQKEIEALNPQAKTLLVATEDSGGKEFGRVIGVNLNGVFHGMAEVLKVMRQQGSSGIVNTASVGGIRGSATSSATPPPSTAWWA